MPTQLPVEILYAGLEEDEQKGCADLSSDAALQFLWRLTL